MRVHYTASGVISKIRSGEVSFHGLLYVTRVHAFKKTEYKAPDINDRHHQQQQHEAKNYDDYYDAFNTFLFVGKPYFDTFRIEWTV